MDTLTQDRITKGKAAKVWELDSSGLDFYLGSASHQLGNMGR